MSEIRVVLADAPRDVLVYLVDHGPAHIGQIIANVAPTDADDPVRTVGNAVHLLHEGGWLAFGGVVWLATEAGRDAVGRARSRAGEQQ